ELRERHRFLDAEDRPVDIDQVAVMRALLAGETAIREQLTVETPGASKRSLLVNSAPLVSDGTVEAAVSVFQDITEIRDADRLKDDFLAMISHELRTPLTAIHGGSQMLLAGLGKLGVE